MPDRTDRGAAQTAAPFFGPGIGGLDRMGTGSALSSEELEQLKGLLDKLRQNMEQRRISGADREGNKGCQQQKNER